MHFLNTFKQSSNVIIIVKQMFILLKTLTICSRLEIFQPSEYWIVYILNLHNILVLLDYNSWKCICCPTAHNSWKWYVYIQRCRHSNNRKHAWLRHALQYEIRRMYVWRVRWVQSFVNHYFIMELHKQCNRFALSKWHETKIFADRYDWPVAWMCK